MMNKQVEEVLKFFNEKPYALQMGANTLSKRTGYPVDLIRSVRNSLRREGKESVSKELKIPKILILDIETAPMRAFVWSRWKQNIYLNQTISEWFMLTWAAKWLHETKIYSDKLTGTEAVKEDDERIVGSLWVMMDEADIVVAHNGMSFDIPKMNSRFIIHGFPPPSPYKQVDTKQVAARQFGFSSNKLDALAGYFNIRHKDDTGFDLWKRCLEGDEEALKYMETYNIGDVDILEKVYLRLRPYIKNHPNVGLYMEAENVCPHCGSNHLSNVEKEYVYTPTCKYALMRCNDCGAVSRSTTNLYPKEKRKQLVRGI